MNWDKVIDETIAGFYFGIRLIVGVSMLLAFALAVFIALSILGAVAHAVAWIFFSK